MIGTCLTCGHFGELEAHHVAGRHNNATLTVLVCSDCHRILSGWQLAAGIELRQDAPRSDLDSLRALAVGVLHVFQLFGQRHPERSWIPGPLAVLTGRTTSRLLDSFDSPHRPGRWLPDPTFSPAEAVPVAWQSASEAERVAELAHLGLSLTKFLGEQPPLPPGLLADVVARPAFYTRAFAAIDEDDQESVRLLQAIAEHSTQAQRLVVRLLTLEDFSRVDEALLEEARLWIDTSTRLLAQTLDLADAARAGSS